MTASPPTGASTRFVCVAIVLLLAVGVRLFDWPQVFTDDGVRFAGNDAYYHILRTQRTVEEYPQAPWVDPSMNFPHGAPIPWPPLFDHTAASAAMIIGGGDPSPVLVERVAAFAPVVLGLLTVPLVASLAWLLLGARSMCTAAFLFAVLPAHVLFSSVGRFDQHVAEVLFLVWIAVAFVAAWRPGIPAGWTWIADVLLGIGICLAYWTWQGSAIHLLFVATFAAIWHLLAPSDRDSPVRTARSLARGGTVGAVLLLVSLLAFAPRGAVTTMSLLAISGFHVALTGLVACFGAALWLLRRKSATSTRSRRLIEVAAAGVVPITAAAALVPGFWAAVRHGLVALGRGNDWYRNIQEFDPLLFAGFEPVWVEAVDALNFFGLGLVLLPFAVAMVIRDRKNFDPAVVCFLVVFAVFFFLLAITRRRFVIYLAVPLALHVAYMWRVVAGKIKEKAGNRFPRSLVTGALGLAIVIPSVGWYADTGTSDTDPSTGDLLATLQWLRGHENPDPTRPGVLAEWSHGHHIEYLAEKPVVANPFGTDIGLDAMADAAEFFLARDPSVAERVVNRRRMGFVMLTNPVEEAHFALAFAPSGTAPVVDVTPARLSEMQVHVDDGFWGLVASRLYFFDGMVPAGYAGEALGGYRLLYESPTDQRWDGHTAKVFKVYGVVAGANISVHTSSGSRVTARTTLTTNQGREVRWASTVVSDLRGTASIRLPYATGLNGAVDASAYELVSASRSTHIEVSEFDVVNGGKAVAFFGAPETLDLQPPTNN